MEAAYRGGRVTMATAIRTYLEMREPAALRPVRLDGERPRIEQVEDCPAEFYRFLYAEVGRRYHWVDRLRWSLDENRDAPG